MSPTLTKGLTKEMSFILKVLNEKPGSSLSTIPLLLVYNNINVINTVSIVNKSGSNTDGETVEGLLWALQ